MMTSEVIAIVTRETRLKGLLAKWGTKGFAKFRLAQVHAHQAAQKNTAPVAAATRSTRHTAKKKHLAQEQELAEFDDYELEDSVYQDVLGRLKSELDFGYPISYVDRSFLPNYDFRGCVAVVVVGQDGLVANAAKYVGDKPIVAVNPDPGRIDGILLPFQIDNARRAVNRVLQKRARIREVTLAEAVLNDGQRILAFNDLFLGCPGHASARYVIRVDGQEEPHSSSGVLVSTGAGSTGWLSSMFNMFRGFSGWLGQRSDASMQMEWDDPRLAWIVREPFRSKQSGADIVAGMLEPGHELVLESLMPSRGVIFSDGIESDYLEFNSGTIATIRASQQKARLVVN